jgi:O-glycosyl hydrolase
MLVQAERKPGPFLIRAAMALAIAAVFCSPLAAGTVAVNAATTYQTIDGFGAATVWNGISTAQAPVLWTDDSTATVANTTAHVNGHVGFSINRTRIDPNEETAGTGNWNGELNQVVLARKTNPNITVFASEWTPPPADKENNAIDSTGNNNAFYGLPTTTDGTTGKATADSDYASYLVKYIQYCNSYLTSNGATGVLNAISPQNEPDFNPGSYESALWTGPQFETFVGSYLGPAMASAGLTATKIIITESFHDNLGLAANAMNDATAAPYVGLIGGHLYGATSPPPTIASAGWSHYTNQHYWETEICDESGAAMSITLGLEEAKWIHTCIVEAGMNAYNHWWINSTGSDSFYNTSSNQFTVNCFAEGNYSKFIRPGFVRVSATEFPSGGTAVTSAPVWCSAYVSPSLNRIVVVAVNNSTSTQAETFNLSGLGSVSQVAPWLTSSSANLVQQSLSTVSGNSFSYTLPAQSVVTFVGDCSPAGTPTYSATPSSTATPAKSATPTSTRTSTPSPSPASTATSTATSSKTATGSASPSPSSTLSKSPTPTFSASPSLTASAEPSASPTITVTPTASPTKTASATASGTGTSSASPTASSTRTATASSTGTRTQSASPTFSATGSATHSATTSVSPSASPTATITPTPTATPSVTATATATGSQSASPSATSSQSPTELPTQTSTASGTPSFSPTATATVTPTAEPSGTATATASATQAPLGGPLRILRAVPVPNPNPASLALDLEGPADGVVLGVFTEALVQVRQVEIPVRLNAGWSNVPLGSALKNLPLGLYFARVQATRAGAKSPAVIIKVLITRR